VLRYFRYLLKTRRRGVTAHFVILVSVQAVILDNYVSHDMAEKMPKEKLKIPDG
jgi:hypothetical protein